MKNLFHHKLYQVAGIVSLMILGGCYYDHEEILYGTGNCTPVANPTYITDIAPILAARCNSCHSGAYASGGIKLDSYDAVMVTVNNGSFLGSIKHDSGFSPMPKNSAKLSNCDIQKIEDWITAGSANN